VDKRHDFSTIFDMYVSQKYEKKMNERRKE